MTDTTSLPSRSDVPLEQTWELASVFATPKDWETACTQRTSMLPMMLSSWVAQASDLPYEDTL